MKIKECSECGTSYTCHEGSPADQIGKCHLCYNGTRTDLYVLRGLIAKSTGIDKHTRVLIEERISLLEEKFMKDFQRPVEKETVEVYDAECDDETEQDGTEQGEDSEDYFATQGAENDIIHLEVIHNQKKSYACNYAVKPTKEKLSTDIAKVTCSNCLRVINKLGK